MTASILLPAGLPLDGASWEQTPLVVRQVVVHLPAVIQQQEERIAALEARLSQTSRNSDRPPSPDPPYEQRTACSGEHGRPGAKRGHPGHRQVLLVPTEVIKVTPEACPCGQREFHAPTPYHTHQVIELPEIQMQVTHVVLAQVNYIDETAWYRHGVLVWLWVMVNTTVALFNVQTSRNKAAFEALVERWAGIVVSDGYGVYQHWVYGRQTCLAHLIRRARGCRSGKSRRWPGLGVECWRSCNSWCIGRKRHRRQGPCRPGMPG